MTKSTQQLADEMAQKCNQLYWSQEINAPCKTLKRVILEQIPLLELLELARAVKRSSKSQDADTALALYNLQKKVEL